MRKFSAILVAAALLAGCSSIKPYEYSGASNIRFKTKTESGSMFSSLNASVHIHSMGKDCNTTYVGTVDLDKKSVRTGIPVGRLSYLSVRFASSSFLGGSSGSTGIRAIVRARPGYRYEVEVSYIDNMFDTVVYEVNNRTRGRKEIAARKDGECGV